LVVQAAPQGAEICSSGLRHQPWLAL